MDRRDTYVEGSELQGQESQQILKVKNYIYSLVQDRKIKMGDRLPSEKALSEQLDVTKSIVRDALQSLKTVGLLSSVRGSGYRLTPNFDCSLADVLHAMVIYSNTSRRDIREVREALELKVLQLMIDMKTKPELIRELEKQTAIMTRYKDKAITTDEEALEIVGADMEFHRLLAHNCDNVFIKSFNVALNRYHDSNTRITPERVQRRVTTELLDTHTRIVDALKEGDMDKAEKAIREHYIIGDRVVSNKEEGDSLLQSTIGELQKKGYSRQEIMDKLMELI